MTVIFLCRDSLIKSLSRQPAHNIASIKSKFCRNISQILYEIALVLNHMVHLRQKEMAWLHGWHQQMLALWQQWGCDKFMMGSVIALVKWSGRSWFRRMVRIYLCCAGSMALGIMAVLICQSATLDALRWIFGQTFIVLRILILLILVIPNFCSCATMKLPLVVLSEMSQ